MIPDSHPISRRDLLAAGLLAAGSLALGGRPAGASWRQDPAGDGAKDEYAPFKVGLQSYSLRHFKLAEALSKTKALGVHFWESYSAHTNPDPAKAAEYKAQAAESARQRPVVQTPVARLRQFVGGGAPPDGTTPSRPVRRSPERVRAARISVASA